MAGKNTAAFAIFPSRSAAEAAVDQLTAAGFSNQDVSVLMSDKEGSKDFATEKNTKAPEGTATGVGIGGTVGGTLGLLAGIGALAIPGRRSADRGRSDHGCARRAWCRRSSGWPRRSTRRDGNT